jgi:phage protein D
VAAGAIAYPVRSPRWVLTYAGVNVTTDISAMVTEILYVDGAREATVPRHRGHRPLRGSSDELEVTLEDRDRRWQGPWFPTRGDIVTLLIGYDSEELLPCGDFQVDELELTGPPDTFHLKCIAAGITPSIRTPRSAAYESQTLLQVANTIAARHSYTVTGAPANINVTWSRLTQRNETDLHFLHNLARDHNYDFSIRGTQLVFYSRTTLEAQAPILTVDRTQTKAFEFKTGTKRIYRSASVAYQNPAMKQLIAVSTTQSMSVTGDDLHIVTRCENAQQAQLKASSALHDANMLQTTGRIETEGTTLLVAGVNITLTGFGQFNGNYHIESSRHRLERSSGYTTEMEVRHL